MRRGTLLALIFASNEQLIGEVKVEGLSCSDHEIVEFRILRGERRLRPLQRSAWKSHMG